MGNNNPQEFISLITNLLKEKDIELPKILESSGRNAYLDFLEQTGYSENEVLPVVDRSKLTGEMYGATIMGLMNAIKSNNKELIKTTAWIAINTVSDTDSTNLILDSISRELGNDIKNLNIVLPKYYVAVYPTNSCNAQARIHNGENLILLDTGIIEISEAFATIILSKEDDNVKVQDIINVIDNYVNERFISNGCSVSSKGINFGSGVASATTTAIEEFIVAHELSHLILGHIQLGRNKSYKPSEFKSTIDLASKSIDEEFDADIMACKLLINRALKSKDSETKMLLTLGGAAISICIVLLVEACMKKNGIQIQDSHPPASERLYMLGVVFELFGQHHLTGMSQKSMDLTRFCLESYYKLTEMPPMLCKEHNIKLRASLDRLKIDYSKMDFIARF